MSDDIRRKTFATEVRDAGAGARALRFVISTSAVDRDGDVIDQDGWDLTAFRRNPVVLFGHNHRDLPVARAVDIDVERGALVATAEFVPGSIYPFAEQVYQMLKAGYLNATSVGFRAQRWSHTDTGVRFHTAELVEFSVVPVPANSEALIIGRGADPARVKSWLGGAGDDAVLELSDDSDGDGLDVSEEAVAWARGFARATRSLNPAVAAGLLEPAIDIDPAELRAALREELPSVIRSATRSAIETAVAAELRRVRGIVD